MVCLYCSGETKVNNSRFKRQTNRIWRRRECLSCRSIFTTIENINLSGALMVEGPKGLEPFNRDRLFLALLKSCEHRNSALTDAGALAQTVIAKLIAEKKSAVISKSDITKMTLETLKHFDSTAATIYSAYHPLA